MIIKKRLFSFILPSVVLIAVFGLSIRITAAADITAPFAIADLSVSSTSTSSTTLSWRAPGDDGGSQQPEYVIVISVDGMGSSYVTPLLAAGDNQMVNFIRFMDEGAGTMNARDDAGYAITLPNHITMMTSRGVAGETGHGWSANTTPAADATIAANKGSYVASAFDVAHDNGLRTGIWAGKTKFNLFQQSYGAATGAVDATGEDNGQDKIDYDKVTNGITAANLATDFLAQMASDPFNFAFVHFQDPDATGHASGWSTDPDSAFAATLKAVDTQIGNILDAIEANSTLNGKTTVILTADHGGHSTTHGDITNPLDYTVPFYVWGADVSVGDLYTLNPSSRTAPAADANPSYTGAQPIRDGDAGNLALSLLGLSAIPNSTINSSLDLVTQNFGTAASYDVRYSTSSITNDNWSSATEATGETAPQTAGATETFSVTGLDSGTDYYFAIKTSDEVPNASGLSNVASGTTVLVAPTIGDPVADSSTAITWTWTANSGNEESFILTFVVGGGADVSDISAGETSYQSTGLTPNTAYSVNIKGYRSNSGESAASENSSEVYTKANTPETPSFSAQSDTQISASWGANNNPDGTYYYIENTTASTNSGWITSRSWVSTGLSCGTAYSFVVRAKNGDGVETENSTAQATTTSCVGGGGGGGGGGRPAYSPPVPPAVLILQLKAKIEELKAQLAQMLGAGQAAYGFQRNLFLGIAGEDVRRLQEYLNNNGFIIASFGPGSKGSETNFFGAMTQNALIRFQKANNISPAIGYFGPLTRAFIK